MNNQIKTRIAKRVADYFVLISAGDVLEPYPDLEQQRHENKLFPLKWTYNAVITDRYPLVDYDKNNPLPDVPQFCFPHGLQIVDITDELSGGLNSSASHTSLISSSSSTSSSAISASSSTISISPSTSSTSLKPLKSQMEIPSSATSSSLPSSASPASSASPSRSHPSNPPPHPVKKKRKPRPSSHAFVLTSVDGTRTLGCCLIFYESITANQLESLKTIVENVQGREAALALEQRELLVPRCMCVISHWSFASSFKEFMCGLYKLSLIPSSIPMERYVCNFIDDVPSPPAGRVDITYYLGDHSTISFRCPPVNQPNVWSGLPLFPLFECLSPEKILSLFALVLTERSILFISSQHSLLTCCVEAITSLMYPLSWTNVYIPLLPVHLLGYVGSPIPFIIGIHSSLLSNPDCYIADEAVRVFLDENRIEYGSQGPGPPLPDRRGEKLLQVILAAAPIFETRGSNWYNARRPFYDDAFSGTSDRPHGSGFDESALRAGFLKFFVAILKNYRKYLNYGSLSDPDPTLKFKFKEFEQEHPAAWREFIYLMINTQSFSVFVDERVLPVSRDQDIVFFDESIDAKMNRYTFKLKSIDTPFLSDSTNNHAKTYVPPTPNTSNLPARSEPYVYKIFPHFDPELFSPPRKVAVSFDSGQSLAMHFARLKRVNGNAHAQLPLSAAACTYSCYIVALAQVVCNSRDKVAATRRKTVRTTTQQIIEEFDRRGKGSGGRERKGSSAGIELYNAATAPLVIDSIDVNGETSKSAFGTPEGRQRSDTTFSGSGEKEEREKEDHASVSEAAKLGLQIAFESLNCLGKLDDAPDDIVYRSLADACGSCGSSSESVDLLVHMHDEGMLPDKFILNAVARAFASDSRRIGGGVGNNSKESGRIFHPWEVWTTEDWRTLQKGNGSLYRRKQNASSNSSSTNGSWNLSTILFGDDDNNASSSSSTKQGSGDLSQNNNGSEVINSNSWSNNYSDGTVPDLQWSFQKSPPSSSASSSSSSPRSAASASSKRKPIFQASIRLRRHMNVCEKMLEDIFPELSIDLCHPFGTACPGRDCPVKRPLTIGEVYRGWVVGNSNKYTTKCVGCGCEFVPRFCVTCSDSAWVGSEGIGTPLWCELLSPWTLRKEVFNVLFDDGIEALLAKEFRNSSAHHAVVFWNAIIAFRLRGLPYSFLLCDNLISLAFPPPPPPIPTAIAIDVQPPPKSSKTSSSSSSSTPLQPSKV